MAKQSTRIVSRSPWGLWGDDYELDDNEEQREVLQLDGLRMWAFNSDGDCSDCCTYDGSPNMQCSSA
ncbi:MAG: hypothetical protein ACKPKO_37055, partial [Candidatus Fonsibacter sp.]